MSIGPRRRVYVRTELFPLRRSALACYGNKDSYMEMRFVLVAGVLLAGPTALSQLRITSFNAGGELTWTNSTYRGFYNVESSAFPHGPWSFLSTVADLDGTLTNRVAFQVPVSNLSGFYRVAWVPPDPIGTWDYRGYDNDGSLVVTGQLSIASMNLLSSNPPVVGYGVQGSRNLNYNGSLTNAPWWLGPQVGTFGTGSFSGTLEFHAARLRLLWPTNYIDFNVELFGTIGPNSYTGTWVYAGWAVWGAGPFSAVRVPSTNLSNNNP